jgi:hypothetical protein
MGRFVLSVRRELADECMFEAFDQKIPAKLAPDVA